MGIDIGASIVVGLPYKDVEHLAEDYEDFGDWIEDNDFDNVSPYFDASREDSVFGVCIANVDYTYLELPERVAFGAEAKEAFERFKKVTGLEPKLYLSPDVW